MTLSGSRKFRTRSIPYDPCVTSHTPPHGYGDVPRNDTPIDALPDYPEKAQLIDSCRANRVSDIDMIRGLDFMDQQNSEAGERENRVVYATKQTRRRPGLRVTAGMFIVVGIVVLVMLLKGVMG